MAQPILNSYLAAACLSANRLCHAPATCAHTHAQAHTHNRLAWTRGSLPPCQPAVTGQVHLGAGEASQVVEQEPAAGRMEERSRRQVGGDVRVRVWARVWEHVCACVYVRIGFAHWHNLIPGYACMVWHTRAHAEPSSQDVECDATPHNTVQHGPQLTSSGGP